MNEARDKASGGARGLSAPRAAIRKKVRDILRATLPAWDSRFYGDSGARRIEASRVAPLRRLPAVLIYTLHERTESESNADPGPRKKTLELAVEVVTSDEHGEDPDDTADLLCAAVENILDLHDTLDLLVESSRLARTEVDMDGEGEHVFVAARMIFEITYWTRPLELPETNGRPGGPPEDDAPPPTSCPWNQENGCEWRKSGGPCQWHEHCVPPPKIVGVTPGLGRDADQTTDDGGRIDGGGAEPAVPPERDGVLIGWAPEIGPPHKQDYRPLEKEDPNHA